MKKLISLLKFVLIIALIGGIGYLFVSTTLASDGSEVGNIKLIIGDYGKSPMAMSSSDFKDYSDMFKDEVEAAIKSGATEKQIMDGIYAIYRVACLSRAEAPYYSTRSVGTGGAGGKAGNADIKGNLTVFSRSFMMKTGDSKGDRKYDKFGFYETYSILSGVDAPTLSPKTLKLAEGTAASALGYGKREATTKDGTTFGATSSSNVESFNEGLRKKENKNWKTSEFKDYETLQDEAKDDPSVRPYPDNWYDEYGKDSPELTNHIINSNTIDKKKDHYIKKTTIDGEVVYQVKFSIDCSSEEATKYSAAGIQDTSSMIKGLKYTKLDIEIEIFESGYMRLWRTAENWAATLDLSILKIEGLSESTNNEIYSYNKTEIEKEIKDNWFGTKPFKK